MSAGNLMMAAGVLKGFGLNPAELAKAKEAWLEIPNFTKVDAKIPLTQRQMEKLEKLAAARNTSVGELIDGEFAKLVNSLLESTRE